MDCSFRRSQAGLSIAVVLVALTALTSFVRPARAYILPTHFVIRMLMDQRQKANIDDLSVQMTTEFVGGDGPVEERIYLKSPQRMRRVEEADDGALYVEKTGKFAVGKVSNLKAGRGPVPELFATFLAVGADAGDQGSKQILATLRAHGVDTSVISLGRLNGRVAFVIGARSWEKDKPQVWIDKDLFLPLRFILPQSQGSSVLVDTRLLEWGSAVAANWFPRVIERYRDAKLVSRSEVTEVQRNQKLPETLFVLPQ